MHVNNGFFIAGRSFVYRDLTLDESEKVEKMLKGMQATDANQISLQLSNKNVKKLLGAILEPGDGQPYDESIFGSMKMKEIAQAISGFFLYTINSAVSGAD